MEKKEEKKENKWIKIKGAKTHNLKNISVSIPRGKNNSNHRNLGQENLLLLLNYLCRGSKKIYRITVSLCETIFKTNAKTCC